MHELTGLIAAPFTPMSSDGSIHLATIERQAAHLIAQGVRGAFVCGTTGEGASLTTAERQQVAARWVEVAGADLAVIVHTGHSSLGDAAALASHAQAIGAHATAAMPPYFFKPAGPRDVIHCCAAIASHAPALPFYYYHIPSMTGVNVNIAEFLEQAGERIPNLAGVKFTHENLLDFAQAQQVAGGRFNMLFGRDEMLLSALPLGTRGAVGSTYNYAARIYLNVMKAFHAADMKEARTHQAAANAVIDLMIRDGGLAAGKAIMRLVGVDCGPVRLPLRSLNEAQIAKLRAELEQVGFFEQVDAVTSPL